MLSSCPPRHGPGLTLFILGASSPSPTSPTWTCWGPITLAQAQTPEDVGPRAEHQGTGREEARIQRVSCSLLGRSACPDSASLFKTERGPVGALSSQMRFGVDRPKDQSLNPTRPVTTSLGINHRQVFPGQVPTSIPEMQNPAFEPRGGREGPSGPR